LIANAIWKPGKEFVDSVVTDNNIMVSVNFDNVWETIWNEANGAVQDVIFRTITQKDFKA